MVMNERHVSFRQEPRSRLAWWVGGAIVAAGIVAAYVYYTHKARDEQDAGPVPVQSASPPPEADAEAGIHHPVPAQESTSALPALGESDGAALGALAGIIGHHSVDQLLVPEGVIKRIVVTIDNLSRDKLAVERRPVWPTSGRLVVEEHGEVAILSAENFARYTPFISAVRAADAAALAKAYFRFYPLFQQSYEDLGYTGRYFNDRVVEVIDHMLQAPEVQEPIRLVQPSVFYKFEDPELEARSAGQKLLIRMGTENARVIKQKLRDLKAEIVRGTQDPGQR
jgi:hypothetical protein